MMKSYSLRRRNNTARVRESNTAWARSTNACFGPFVITANYENNIYIYIYSPKCDINPFSAARECRYVAGVQLIWIRAQFIATYLIKQFAMGFSAFSRPHSAPFLTLYGMRMRANFRVGKVVQFRRKS